MDIVTMATRLELHEVGFNLGSCLKNEHMQVIR